MHTAVDTTACLTWETIAETLEFVDLFLVDLKHMDEEKHERYTGVSNEPVLENIGRLAELDQRIIIRIPLIPGVNDDWLNISSLGEFLSPLGSVAQVDLLPYNEGAYDKFSRMIDDRRQPGYSRPAAEAVEEIADRLRQYGLNVTIGG